MVKLRQAESETNGFSDAFGMNPCFGMSENGGKVFQYEMSRNQNTRQKTSIKNVQIGEQDNRSVRAVIY